MRNSTLHRLSFITMLLGVLLLAVAAFAQAPPRHHTRPRHNPGPPPPAAAPADPDYEYDDGGSYRALRTRDYFPRLYLGAGYVGSRLQSTYDFPDVDRGGRGLHIFGGLRFNRRVAMEMGWLGAWHDAEDSTQIDSSFQAGTLDLKVFLLPPAPVELYLLGGVGIYGFSSDQTGEALTGGGLQGGGGLDLHLGRELTVGARLTYHGATIDNGDEVYLPSERAALRLLEGEVHLRLDF